MAQPNVLSFATPELQAQQAELERQQALADMLRQQSMTPLESTSVSNPNGGSIAVKTNPWAGIAKLGQAYFAGQGQKNVNEQRLAMAKALQEGRSADMQRIATAAEGTPAVAPTPANDAGQMYNAGNNPDEQSGMGYQPATAGTPAIPPMSGKDLAKVMMSSPYEDRQQMGEKLMFSKPEVTVIPQGGIAIDGNGKTIANGEPKRIPPLVEHNFPVGKDMVQPHVSLDNGLTWEPIPGSEKSHKFAKQITQIGGNDKFSNIQPDGNGGYIGQDRTGTMRPVPMSQELIDAQKAASANNGLTGDEFLKTVSPADAAQIKAYAEGRRGFPTNARNNPAMIKLMTQVAQYDPTFDQTDYNRRNKTATAFAAGPTADKVRNVNQSLVHAEKLQKNIDALDNYNTLPIITNPITNWAGENFGGQSAQGNFRGTVQALSSELRKLFASQGGGGLAELNKWESSIPENAGKQQQTDYLQNGMDLLKGGMSALENQYREGMGPKASISHLFSPEAKKAMVSLGFSGAPASPQPQQPQQQVRQQPQSSLAAQIPTEGKQIVRKVPLKDGRIGVEYSDGSRGFQ